MRKMEACVVPAIKLFQSLLDLPGAAQWFGGPGAYVAVAESEKS